jgi:hypothetical protein
MEIYGNVKWYVNEIHDYNEWGVGIRFTIIQ